MKRIGLLSIIALIIASCGQPVQTRYPGSTSIGGAFGANAALEYMGYLHLNKCVGGSSFLSYNNTEYAFGSKSAPQFSEMLGNLSTGNVAGVKPISPSNSCVDTFRIEFNGELTTEASPVSSGGTEEIKVVHIYQFRML